MSRYSEFMPDIAKVSRLLSSSQLEANKVAFVNEFKDHQEFHTKYDGTLNNPSAYVNAVMNTAGVKLPQKQTLINDLTARREIGEGVLRAIAESVEIYQKFYTESFVIMQYFGYLRRDLDTLYLKLDQEDKQQKRRLPNHDEWVYELALVSPMVRASIVNLQ